MYIYIYTHACARGELSTSRTTPALGPTHLLNKLKINLLSSYKNMNEFEQAVRRDDPRADPKVRAFFVAQPKS